MHHRGSPSLRVGVDKTGGGDDGGAAFLHSRIMFPCHVCTEKLCFVLYKWISEWNALVGSVWFCLLTAEWVTFSQTFLHGLECDPGCVPARKECKKNNNDWTWLEELTIVGSKTVASELSSAAFPHVQPASINVLGSVSDFDSVISLNHQLPCSCLLEHVQHFTGWM